MGIRERQVLRLRRYVYGLKSVLLSIEPNLSRPSLSVAPRLLHSSEERERMKRMNKDVIPKIIRTMLSSRQLNLGSIISPDNLLLTLLRPTHSLVSLQY